MLHGVGLDLVCIGVLIYFNFFCSFIFWIGLRYVTKLTTASTFQSTLTL